MFGRRPRLSLIVAASLAGTVVLATPAGASGSSVSCSLTPVHVPVPAETRLAALYDVKAISATDAWAVGMHAGADGRPLPLAEHWDGTAWSSVPVPLPQDRHATSLRRLVAISSTDVWAIGNKAPGRDVFGVEFLGRAPTPNQRVAGVLYHWDGVRWSLMRPRLGHAVVSFAAIEATGPDDLWVAGSWQALPGGMGGSAPPILPLFLHWDGTTWTARHPVLFPGSAITWVSDLDLTARTGVVAVGSQSPSWRSPSGGGWFGATRQGASWTVATAAHGPSAVSQNWGVGGSHYVPNPQLDDQDIVDDVYQLGVSAWEPAPSPIVAFSPDNGWGSTLTDVAWVRAGFDAWSVGYVENQDGGGYIAGSIAEEWRYFEGDWVAVTLPAVLETDWLVAVDVAPVTTGPAQVFMAGAIRLANPSHLAHAQILGPLIIQTVCSPF